MSGHTPWKAIKHKSGITAEQYLAIAKFCAEEVGRQYHHSMADGKPAALAVGGMIEAWLDAIARADLKQVITVPMIEQWGKFIEPKVNDGGFRTFKIWVGSSEGMPPSQVRMAMQHYVDVKLVELAHDPDQAYKAFEEIHPFGDGNGRVGKIVFCYIRGILHAPEWPFNFWNISNP